MAAREKKPKGLTKAQMISELATKTSLQKAQVSGVIDALVELTSSELKAKRPVTIGGLVKITVVRKAATAARPGRNPKDGSPITIKAKPARTVVKVRALKGLKDMA